MAASFTIADGNPDVQMSDWIWCRRSLARPDGWVPDDDIPPGEFENPFFREDNWVWVKVHQSGAVEAQTVGLYLYAGIDGLEYTSDQIREPFNQFVPEDLWPTSTWESQFNAGKVCRIPWFNGVGTADFCPISQPANQPGSLNSLWYLFKLERHLIPPTTGCTTWRIALMPVIEDSAITGATDFTVAGNPGFSQRNCLVV